MAKPRRVVLASATAASTSGLVVYAVTPIRRSPTTAE